ncbi:MAG TPA: Uma2 family endonuclease [Candidatus Polarisedimenticolaceae bacterium]|nr:Uma2 family endonuclease [Candidatus Polarisedimenticolaceae bacterium]
MAEPRPDEGMTAEDLFALPEDAWRYELQAGFLLREPHPVLRHGRMLVRLGALLEARAAACGALVVGDFDVILARRPDTVRAPDLAVFSPEQRRSLDPDRPHEGAPALVIEILSPSNRPGDMHAKIADYLAAGASLVWVVDPWTDTVRIYRTLLAPRVLRGEDRLDGGEVLPDVDLCVRDLFGDDLPPPRER